MKEINEEDKIVSPINFLKRKAGIESHNLSFNPFQSNFVFYYY